MHIIGLVAENVKKIRAIEIEPKGRRLVQITGKNGQGKTSVLDAIWYGLVGKRALPEKPVRKGADKAKIKLNLGELTVTRTISSGGGMTLHVEDAKGTKFTSPQQVLDELLGELTFDPLAFIAMKGKEQINALRSVVKLDIDVDQLNAATQADFNERRDINRDADRLRAEVSTITVQEGLPKDRQDESEILAQLTSAGELNKKAEAVTAHRAELKEQVVDAQRALDTHQQAITNQQSEIAELEATLQGAKAALKDLQAASVKRERTLAHATKAYENAPVGEMVDVGALTEQLQKVQLTNREIDKRIRRDELRTSLAQKQRASDDLTRKMEAREEQKRAAVTNAKMPVPGLSFDEESVTFNGIPLDQLGEAEQIRISTSIAMAANPKLRIMRVMHGEALDSDSLALLSQMAEENDFQIWMARVDSSGKVGIVMEDGNAREAE